MQVELARLSSTDALTGLSNRRRFDEVFATAWDSSRRTRKPVSLILVDVDHFKRFNDRYGHTVGDDVLKGLARCLSASVHRPDDLVARVGGEEFAILLADTDAAGALRIADKVHEELATLSVASAGIGAGSVTASIGVATEAGVPAERLRRSTVPRTLRSTGLRKADATRPDARLRPRRSGPAAVIHAPNPCLSIAYGSSQYRDMLVARDARVGEIAYASAM